MKVYLGGKMSGKGRGENWRNEIVDHVEQRWKLGDEYEEVQGIDLLAACGTGDPPMVWPVLENAILGKHAYVGPYLVACDHGCYHTGDHASSIEFGHGYDISSARNRSRNQIASLCKFAMLTADILFFWIDSLDAYGTIAELIFATTAIRLIDAIAKEHKEPERKRYVFVASPSFEDIDEMWLVMKLAWKANLISAPNPKEAFLSAMALVEDDIEYSPIEKMFIDSWRTIYGNGIASQYNVPGFRYRVDFAFPSDKVAIELDGYEYHNSKEQFTNDRKRQRQMELAGWRFIRFSGSEVYRDAEACVRQAYEFWQSMARQHDTGYSNVILNGVEIKHDAENDR